VLTLDVGGIKDIVVDGITGIIIPKRDASLFAEKLVDLVNDDVLRNELSMRGWDFVGEKYNYSTLVANMSAYYKELLA
jgi:glycosyltransferase involved in cell wall biosynthesis